VGNSANLTLKRDNFERLFSPRKNIFSLQSVFAFADIAVTVGARLRLNLRWSQPGGEQ
jgi:hypothetical protein